MISSSPSGTAVQIPEYDPDRRERIRITFRAEKGSPPEDLNFELRSRYAIPFHWWMRTQGFGKA